MSKHNTSLEADQFHHHRIPSDDPPLYSDQPSGSTSTSYPQPSSVEPFSVKNLDASKSPPTSLIDSELDHPSSPPTEPPDFSVYQASYKIDLLGNIISHDPHLNSDGEALCRFILLHASTPPTLMVKITGTHEDVRIETTTEYVNGRTEYNTREQRITVTDFCFMMHLPSEEALEHGVRDLYVVSDGEVVGRGGNRSKRGKWENGKDLGLLHRTEAEDISPDLPGRATAGVGFKERQKADRIAQEVRNFGHPPSIPPWMFPYGTFSYEPNRPPNHLLGPNWQEKCSNVFNSLVHRGYYRQRKLSPQALLKVERELRQWCDDYCANKKKLKEFRVRKSVFGWNLALLHGELFRLLHTTPHLSSTHFEVDFIATSCEITIRPVNSISKIFSMNGFTKFILTITLIYPILWIMRYLFFGAQYDVIRVAYPLAFWKKSRPDVKDQLVGQTELDWFSANQDKIALACQNSKFGSL